MVKNINVMYDFRSEDKEKKIKTKNLFIENNILYSYGYHYPLCFKVKNPYGFTYFINSDNYSKTTNKHKGHLIRCITRLKNFGELLRAKKRGEYEHIILLSTDNLILMIEQIKEKNINLSDVTINDIVLIELEKH